MVTSDGVEIHDYELPDARFTDAGASGFQTDDSSLEPGESLAKKRARQRREARKAQQAQGEDA